MFVESTERAHSHIKGLSPHLIIVCLDIDELDGFQVLSMLKLDLETRHPDRDVHGDHGNQRRVTHRPSCPTMYSISRRRCS